jgi:23S rRNA (uracil1939-C5)-methyltransferase
LARNKKQLPLLEKVTITDVAAEGKAIARVNDMVVFVPFVAPGDVIDIQLTRKKHSYAEGKAVFFHEYSPRRAEPFCEHSVYAAAVNGNICPMRNRFATNTSR